MLEKQSKTKNNRKHKRFLMVFATIDTGKEARLNYYI